MRGCARIALVDSEQSLLAGRNFYHDGCHAAVVCSSLTSSSALWRRLQCNGRKGGVGVDRCILIEAGRTAQSTMALELWRRSFAAAGVGTFGVRAPHATGCRGAGPVPRCRRFLSVGLGGRRTLRRAEWTQWSLEPDEPMGTARFHLGMLGVDSDADPLAPLVIAGSAGNAGNAGISRERGPGAWAEAAFPRAAMLFFARAAVALSLERLSNQQQSPVRISVHVACRRGQAPLVCCRWGN